MQITMSDTYDTHKFSIGKEENEVAKKINMKTTCHCLNKLSQVNNISNQSTLVLHSECISVAAGLFLLCCSLFLSDSSF